MVGLTTKLPDLPWVREMQAVHGLHEVRDRAKLAAWLRSDGKTLGDPSKLPWCGDAIDTAIARALPNEPRPDDLGKNPYWALNWLFLGVKTSPVYGAIGAFKRPGGGHVGILMAQDKGAFLVLRREPRRHGFPRLDQQGPAGRGALALDLPQPARAAALGRREGADVGE
jgi:hypothetical protein